MQYVSGELRLVLVQREGASDALSQSLRAFGALCQRMGEVSAIDWIKALSDFCSICRDTKTHR